MMKIYPILLLLSVILLEACYDDEGNYDYRETDEVSIENIPEVIEVLGGADHIVVEPKVVSVEDGEIAEGDPRYEFSYRIEKKSGGTINRGERWVDLNPSGALGLDTLASFAPGNYIVWFTVSNVETGLDYSTTFDVKVTSPTYEGWMVLCDEGEEERVRMDMVSVISADRIVPAYNVLETLGLPEIHHATGIGFYPNLYANPNDVIYVMSEEGAFKLNRENFQTDKSWEIGMIDFIIPPVGESIVEYENLNSGGFPSARACFCISDKGNAYAQVLGTAGAAFEYPINTSVRGGNPEYKVAPFVGVSMARPGNGNGALFYDIDNRRFVGWRYSGNVNARQTLSPLQNPENSLFDFQTGMKLLHMESTRYSGGLVYAVLEGDDGRRSVYGINMSGSGFVQEACYADLDAPDFDKASAFAFHSQFPFMFYAAGNKVYLHNLGTGKSYRLEDVSLGDGEVVTLLKFNLYQQTRLELLADKSEEFLARQFELMVGSFRPDKGENGGRLGFYPVDGIANTVTRRVEYEGFARIRDVVYRERR